MHDLTDDVANNVERIRRTDKSAFPDLPSPDKWPPALPVTPEEIAADRAYMDETFALENDTVSRLKYAIDELGDLLRYGDTKYEDLTDVQALNLLLVALGREPLAEADIDARESEILTEIAQDLGALADERALRFIQVAQESGVPIIHIDVPDLIDAITQGRIKSQFETGSSRGHFNPTSRADWEYQYLDQPEDMPDPLRPIYGALDVSTSGLATPHSNVLRQYGGVRIVLKDDIKDRSLLTIGDSLNTSAQPYPIRGSGLPFAPTELYSRTARRDEIDHLLGTMLQDQIDDSGRALELLLESMGFDPEAAYDEEGWILEYVKQALFPTSDVMSMTPYRDISDYPWSRSYIEMQILGGLSLYDISEIVFPASAEFDWEGNAEFKALLKVLKELGIPYSFGN